MAENRINKDDIIDLTGLIKDLNEAIVVLEKLSKTLGQDLTQSAKAAREALNAADATTKKGQTTIKKSVEITNRLTREQKELIIQQEKLGRAKREFRKQTKLDIAAAGSQKGSINSLKAEINRLATQYDKMGQGATGASTRIRALKQQLLKLQNQTKANTGFTQKMTSSWKTAGKQLLTMTGLAGGATIIISKLGRAFKDTRKEVQLFESTFTNVLTLLNQAQKAQFEQILSIGAVNIMARYGLEIEEVNNALFDVLSAGIPAGEAIGFLNESAKLALAGNANLGDVIKGTTKTLESYDLGAEHTTEVLNAFFAAQVKGQTTVGLLAANIGKVASQAAAAGIPVNELFGTFAGLTKFLDGTEEASTALANVIKALIAPSEQAVAVFDSLGIETGITAIKQDGLLNKILEVAAAYEGNNDILTELIPNIRAFKGIAGLSAESISDIEKNILDLNDAEASAALVQGALNEQLETGNREGKQIKQTWKAFFVELGGGESIFKKVGSFFNNVLIKAGENAVVTLRALRIAVARVFDIFRKEGEKKAEQIYLDYVNANKNIVEDVKETTVELTDEEKKRQEDLAEITRRAREKMSADDLAEAKKLADAKMKLFIKNAEQEVSDNEFMLGLEAENEKFHQENIIAGRKETARITKELNEQATREAKEELEKQKLAEKEAREEKFQNIQFGIEMAAQAADSLANIFEAQKQRELSAVGDNAEARAQIEAKYRKKQQTISISQAVLNGALGITKTFAEYGFTPVGIVAAALLAATTAAEVAVISSQKFSKGGFGVLGGNMHASGGTHIPGIGEAEKGEAVGIISRRATSNYGADMLEGVFKTIENGSFYDVWGTANRQISINAPIDPYTRKMYEHMINTPSYYIDSNGATVEVLNGQKRVINPINKN